MADKQSKSSEDLDKKPNAGQAEISPATLEALKTLSSMGTGKDLEKLTNCNKLTASLEHIRASKNTKLFEKLDNIRQEFSGLNRKLTQMEETISDLKQSF